jgi:hypothetical protein
VASIAPRTSWNRWYNRYVFATSVSQ